MTAGTLKMWRAVLRLSQAEAAEKLGISMRQYQNYEWEKAGIPRTVALACSAVFANLGEWIK